jgi:hypothetical protein
MQDAEKLLDYAEKVAYFRDKHGLDDDGWCVECQKCHKLKGGKVEPCTLT